MIDLPPLAHKAVLVVTGWANRRQGRDLVSGIWLQTLLEHLRGTRMTARLYPSATSRGQLHGPQGYGGVRPVRAANGQTFKIITRLIRADEADNLLTLQLFTIRHRTMPSKLAARVTPAVIRQVDPSWSAVRLTGDLLVADQVELAHAPIPTSWSGCLKGRRPRSQKAKGRRTKCQ